MNAIRVLKRRGQILPVPLRTHTVKGKWCTSGGKRWVTGPEQSSDTSAYRPDALLSNLITLPVPQHSSAEKAAAVTSMDKEAAGSLPRRTCVSFCHGESLSSWDGAAWFWDSKISWAGTPVLVDRANRGIGSGVSLCHHPLSLPGLVCPPWPVPPSPHPSWEYLCAAW